MLEWLADSGADFAAVAAFAAAVAAAAVEAAILWHPFAEMLPKEENGYADTRWHAV